MIEINHTLLSADALNSILIEFITRDATEYGNFEVDLQQKIMQIKRKLESGEVIIVYCSSEGSCEIVNSDSWKMQLAVVLDNH